VLANYHLAVGRFRFLYGMGAAILVFGVGLTFFHSNPYQMMAVIAVTGWTLFVWNVMTLRRSKG
jgi:hypothetical protein